MAVTTMLQTTVAHVLTSSQNATEPEMPQAYERDLALTAVVCFAGGAGLALLVALACYRAVHRRKLKERERRKAEEKEGGAVANHGVRRSGAGESRRDVTPDTRPQGRGAHVWPRSDEDGGYFRCSDCSDKGQRAARPNPTTWNNRINTEAEEDEEKRTGGTAGEDERRIPNRPNASSPVYETDWDLDSYRVNVDSRSTGKETFHCESCLRTHRAQQSARAGRFRPGTRDPAPPAHRWTPNQQDATRTTEPGRGARSVTFDLEGLVGDGGGGTPRGREQSSEAQSSLKVKLNLNPLRKSKVHPRKRSEQERAAERGRRPRGKERRERGGKGTSGGEVKGSPGKKATRSRRRSDDGADAKEDDDKAGGKPSETDRERSVDPDGARSAPTDPAPDSQGGAVQCQGTALSLPAPGRTQTTNLPLLGSAGSQLTGSGLPLQGGNLLLGSVAPRFSAVFPGGPAAPSVATSGPSMGPSMGPSGALDSFSRQTGLNLMSPAASLLANSSVHVNPLQATPLYVPPAGGLALNLAAALSEPVFQTQLLPDSVSLPLGLTADPIEALGLQLGEELNKLVPESQAPQITESLVVQVQAADGLLVGSSQALSAQTEPGLVPGGGAAAEGPDAPASGASGDGADGPVLLHQEYVTEEGDSSPRRKLKLALPEKTSSRPPTALERKIR